MGTFHIQIEGKPRLDKNGKVMTYPCRSAAHQALVLIAGSKSIKVVEVFS